MPQSEYPLLREPSLCRQVCQPDGILHSNISTFIRCSFFSPLKIFLDSWGSQMDFLDSIHWNYFTAVSLRNAVVFFFFFKEKQVWFEGLKEIWCEPGAGVTSWNKRLMCSQKYIEQFTSLCPCLCNNDALKSWLVFLLWSWDFFLICCSVQSKGSGDVEDIIKQWNQRGWCQRLTHCNSRAKENDIL